MRTKGGLVGAAVVAAALIMVGCQPLANIGEKGNPTGQHYIKLVVDVPQSGRAISVTDYQVTSLAIAVHDPDGVGVYSNTWDVSQGDLTEMIPVEKTGEYTITVTHYGEHDGQSVEATESRTFTIGAMVITEISIVPGSIGTINVVGGTSPTTHTVSGKIVDGTTGAPLSGGVIDFAGRSATSGADGSYTLDLGASTGTVSGQLSVHASGYMTSLFDPISVDASHDWNATWVPQRIDSTGLPRHSLNLRIYELQSNSPTPTEIPNGTPVKVSIINENGARAQTGTLQATYNGGYPWYSTLSGLSCIVSVYVDLASVSSMYSFNVVATGVSLAATSQDLELYEDPSGEQTITITGDAPGNTATLSFASPNGVFYATEATLDGSAQATVHLLNPYGWEGFWTQYAGQLAFASTAIGPIAPIVPLPVVPSAVSATPPNYTTLSYASGVLSVSPGTGLDSYGFWLTDAGGNRTAIMSSVGPSLALPAWMKTELAGTTQSVMVYGSVSNLPSIDISTLALMFSNAGIAPSAAGVLVMGGSKDLTF